MRLANWSSLLVSLALLCPMAACTDGQSVVGGRLDATLADTPAPDVAPDLPAPDVAPDATDARVGCGANADCVGNAGGAVCDVPSGRCVECVTSDACPAGRYCGAANRCLAGCRDDASCTMTVDGGAAMRRCDPMTRACVDCLTDDQCAPGTRCVSNACVPGCSPTRACPAGQACCAGACADVQTSPANCGACDMACRTANGTPACRAGACAVGACTAPFADCDMNAANGCEADTLSSLEHCGGCGRQCPSRGNAMSRCLAGRCEVTCDPGFSDCDMDPSNGCEADTRASVLHCGGCGMACAPPNAVATCAAGACGIARCNDGFGDCDGMVANGCEVDLRVTVDRCGMCGNACPARANATPTCAAGRCGFTCAGGFLDCDGNEANGCEVDPRTSAAHCGGCGRTCAPAQATGVCTAGACGVGMCEAGFADCNTNPADGCEVSTATDARNCGACGTVCNLPGGTSVCVAGACRLNTCLPGRGDCDMNAGNGCETDIVTTVAHCGACGRACDLPNATPGCAASACTVASCNAGFADCDANPANGCEVDTRVSAAHCGRCGNACFACAAGACVAGSTAARDGSVTAGVDLRYQYSPVAAGMGVIQANWDATTGATQYQVRVGTTPGGAETAADRMVTGTSVMITGLTLRGAWEGVTYYVRVVPFNGATAGMAATSNGVQIAEAASWDGVSTVGITRGVSVNWPVAGVNAWYGTHYFETVTVAAGVTVRAQGFGRVGMVGEGVASTDARVTTPQDGWLAVYANTITVNGTVTASGRGYGGGGGGGGGAGSLGLRGRGGVNGAGGNGGNGEGSITGGGGGGSPGGVGGTSGMGPGGNGTMLGGGSGGTGCIGSRGRDGGDGPVAEVGGTGAVASSGSPGLGGAGEFERGGATGVAGCDNWSGGGGGGYGGGGSGGGQWDGPGAEAGGGGGGGCGGGGGGEGADGRPGAGPFAGNGGGAAVAGQPGGYGAAGGNGDTSTDRSLRLGSGGGGGGAGNSQEAGGAGGGAGGGHVTLYAADRLVLGATGRVVANGAGGGGGSRDDGGGSTSASGGTGAGGGVLLEGRAVEVQGTLGTRVSARGGNAATTNGGTIKIFYGTWTGDRPAAGAAGRVFDATAGSFR